MTGPLSHITVIDLTRARSGPTCVRQLADWGAEVIAVTARGDEDVAAGSRSSDYQNLQRNKRSMFLDVRKPEGLAVLKRLVERADVVVENFRPDVKHRLGIDYEALSAVNPRLIYGSISGFGQSGPYANRPGYDQIAQGLGGLMSVTGLPGQGPVRVGIPIADLTAGIFLAQGILVALIERESSGRGQWVHTSLLQAMATMLDFQAARWLIDGQVPPQAGNDHPTGIPTGVFKTSDGYINIASSSQAMFRRLCPALSVEALVTDPRFESRQNRSRNRHELHEELERALASDTSAHWVERLNAAGVPCGPIFNIQETYEDEHVQTLPLVATVTHPTRGELRVQAHPTTLERTPASVRLPAPDPGEHTDAILAEFGYDATAIAALRAAEAI